MENYFANNENYYSDIKILLYPDPHLFTTWNAPHKYDKYVLCAHHLSFVYEKDDSGYYRVVQKMPLGVLSKLGDEKNIKTYLNSKSFISNFNRIVTIDDAPLLFIVQNRGYFFEVKRQGFGLGHGVASYYSHKFSLEEMKSLFTQAYINTFFTAYACSSPQNEVLNLSISSIWRLDQTDEVEKYNSPDNSQIIDNCHRANPITYPRTEIIYGFPRWSENLSNDLVCSISTRGRIICFEISYSDFTPHYRYDRDGGYDFFFHEEIVIGQKLFQTFYSLQEYMLKISHLDDLIYESIGESDILDCKLPFELKGILHFRCSVKELFNLLDIKNSKTICKTNLSKVFNSDDELIYGTPCGPLW